MSAHERMGFRAFRRGDPRHACPFGGGGERTRWQLGWDLAARDEERDVLNQQRLSDSLMEQLFCEEDGEERMLAILLGTAA